ncbi:MAG: hypothetical protein MJY44_04955 [Bacteroidales bacterium]|nr:hypothetical protein [Bacteroidales bacterium]
MLAVDNPFIYTSFASGKHFICRQHDSDVLAGLIDGGGNAYFTDGARTGKTSVIRQALYTLRVRGRNTRTVEVPLLNARSAEDLCRKVGGALFRAVASTPDEYAALVREHLAGTVFTFDNEYYSATGEPVKVCSAPQRGDLEAILNLPRRITASGEKTIVIFDEFQNVMLADEAEDILPAFENVLRTARAEGAKNFSFIFTGSSANSMKDIFEVHKRFWGLADRIALSEPQEKEVIDHIIRGFLAGGKVIDRELARRIFRNFKGNLWYINHFCAICDSLARGYVTEAILADSLFRLISIHEPTFTSTVNGLTTFQTSLLKAVAEGHTKFSSAEVINRYGLNSSANVKRLKDALCKKEIITFSNPATGEGASIIDPLFEFWLKKYYFEILH